MCGACCGRHAKKPLSNLSLSLLRRVGMAWWEIIIDACFYADMIVTFWTGYDKGYEIVHDKKEVAVRAVSARHPANAMPPTIRRFWRLCGEEKRGRNPSNKLFVKGNHTSHACMMMSRAMYDYPLKNRVTSFPRSVEIR